MLRWNDIFQMLPPNCRPWKPIRISAKVYLKLNTGLPASAALERLRGRVFSPPRSSLSSEHFEMMLFLCTAAKW